MNKIMHLALAILDSQVQLLREAENKLDPYSLVEVNQQPATPCRRCNCHRKLVRGTWYKENGKRQYS